MKPIVALFAALILTAVTSQTLVAQDVGIGTSNPQSTLHVRGNQRIGGANSFMKFDSLSGKIEWTNSNLFVPVTQALMKHSAAGDGLFYNNSGGVNGQLEYRNALGQAVFFTNFINGNGYFKTNLGIGIEMPQAKVHIVSTGNEVIRADAASPYISLYSSGVYNGYFWRSPNSIELGSAAGSNLPITFAPGGYQLMYVGINGNVGIGTLAPSARLHVADSSVLFSATGDVPGTAGPVPQQGAGRRMMWYPDKAAFRVGYTGSYEWDQGNIGNYSFAAGYSTFAYSYYSTAFGKNTIASGDASIATGNTTWASGSGSTTMGRDTRAWGDFATALGDSTSADGDCSITMGDRTNAYGYASTAMGYLTTAKALGAVTIGVLNDNTDSPNPDFPNSFDRMFQIGNGYNFFGITRSNAFTVLRNGNVGIRTADPAFPLSFATDIGDKISLWSNSSNSYGFGIQSALLQIHTDVSFSNIAFGFGSSDVFTERARIINYGGTVMDLSGRVVMRNGTTPLDLNYGPGVWLYKADNSAMLGFMGTQNNQNVGFYGGPGGWGFTYDAINSRVGIGNATPAYTLDVISSGSRTANFVNTMPTFNGEGVYSSCVNAPGQGIGMYGLGGRAGVYGVAIVSGAGNRYGVFGIANNGNSDNFGTIAEAIGGVNSFGLYGSASGGTVSNWAGYFVGNVYSTGTYQGSDRKLKTGITPLTGAMSIISQLNPTLYSYNIAEYQQMHFPEGIHYGLIADEVEKIIPGIVKRTIQPAQYENHNELTGRKLSDEVEFNAVNYTEMIPILIGAVKEQQVMIEELKLKNQQIEQQQEHINALMMELEVIKETLRK